MQLSFCHVSLGVVATLVLICKVYGSEGSNQLQGEVRKRIFCNFYGCGSKRSGANKMADLGGMNANMADLDAPEVVRRFSANLARDESFGDVASQEAAFVASQKILRAATMWEALKEKLKTDRAHKLYSGRNSS